MTDASMHCCDCCGKDTPVTSIMCDDCSASYEDGGGLQPWDLWQDELSYDYSEDSLGPKLGEDRMGARPNIQDGEVTYF